MSSSQAVLKQLKDKKLPESRTKISMLPADYMAEPLETYRAPLPKLVTVPPGNHLIVNRKIYVPSEGALVEAPRSVSAMHFHAKKDSIVYNRDALRHKHLERVRFYTENEHLDADKRAIKMKDASTQTELEPVATKTIGTIVMGGCAQ